MSWLFILHLGTCRWHCLDREVPLRASSHLENSIMTLIYSWHQYAHVGLIRPNTELSHTLGKKISERWGPLFSSRLRCSADLLNGRGIQAKTLASQQKSSMFKPHLFLGKVQCHFVTGCGWCITQARWKTSLVCTKGQKCALQLRPFHPGLLSARPSHRSLFSWEGEW